MKDIKIDVDFEDTCIDFGKYVHDHCRVSFGQVEIDELWEAYQDNMNKEVRDILTDDMDVPEPNDKLKEAAAKYKDTIKEAEPTQKEIEVNKYGELLKDFMEPYIEKNTQGNDTIEIANSELEDFYYSLGWRVRRWVKVAISREKEKKMTAEEFYKDHFGHTSQHVSMDKIFVCMELYVRHQKVVQEEFDSNHKFSTYDESKPISGNKYYCGHTTPCDCEPEIK